MVKSHIIKERFSLGKLNERIFFETVNAKHGKTNSLVYIFEKTAYISDCNDLSIINNKQLQNLKFLVLDCLKYIKHPTHFNLDEAIYVHNHLRPKKTILTNLHYDIDYRVLLNKLPKNILPGYDGLQLNLF